MKDKLRHILCMGCVINSVAVLILSAAANLFSIGGFAPKFSTVLMVLIFSVAVSFANTLMGFERLSFILRIIIHYAAVTAAFYVIFILWSGFAQRASTVLIIMFLYTVVYAVIMFIAYGIKSIRQRKRSAVQDTYESQF